VTAAAASMELVRCTSCGGVYMRGNVEVVARHADCTVFVKPCCGQKSDDRRWPLRIIETFEALSPEERRRFKGPIWLPNETGDIVCEGHLCVDDADRFPHSYPGQTFECDGRCRPEAVAIECVMHDGLGVEFRMRVLGVEDPNAGVALAEQAIDRMRLDLGVSDWKAI
jgi:hypothetical protein